MDKALLEYKGLFSVFFCDVFLPVSLFLYIRSKNPRKVSTLPRDQLTSIHVMASELTGELHVSHEIKLPNHHYNSSLCTVTLPTL